MRRLPGVVTGTLAGGMTACLLGVILQIDDLQGSDGLAPGFAVLIVILLSGVGMSIGGVVGWFWAPRFNRFLADLRLKEQLKPPDERREGGV